MESDSKRYFIYNNIDALENHDHFIKILHTNKCDYTNNNNGIFVNLNTISDTIIDELFFILNSEINSDNKIDIKRNDFIEKNIQINEKKEKKKLKKDIPIKKYIYIKDFPKEEGDIIKMSKNK